MRRALKVKTFILLLVTLTLCVSQAFVGFAEIERKDGIDALLLIDLSGSMNSSDSSRNAIEATKMFIDMLETQNSRVGIIGFNDSLTGVVDITDINTPEDKEKLKDVVDGFKYDGYTDIGMPLKEAVSIMSRNMRASNSPMILLLTDGNVDVNTDTGRTQEASYEDIVTAITESDKKLPIYTIGLNFDGSVDRQLLKTISESTGGRNFIISLAEGLPQIFNEIFADHVKSSLFEVATFTADGDSYTDVNIDISDDFVAVANIIMLAENEIQDTKLINPNGEEVAFDQDTISFSASNKYSIVKVLFPQKGFWTLKAKGVKGDQVKVNLIYQYNVSMDMEVLQEEAIGTLFAANKPISVKGHIVVNGERSTEDGLFRNTSSNLIVNDNAGNLIAKIPMTATKDGLTAEYTPSGIDPINIFVELNAENFTKESVKQKIEFENLPTTPEPTEQAPVVTPKPTPVPKEPMPLSKMFTLYVIGAVIILGILGTAFVIYTKRSAKPRFFEGYLEVRAMNEAGMYTSLETAPLHTYVGTIDLKVFLTDNLPSKIKAEIGKLPFNIKGVSLTPTTHGAQSAIAFENKSGSLLQNEDEVKLEDKKLIWRIDEKMIIKSSDEDSIARLELTYRVDEI